MRRSVRNLRQLTDLGFGFNASLLLAQTANLLRSTINTRTISLSTHLINSKQLCIQPRTSALSAPLPAFAAERRAAGCSRLQLLRGAASCRPISPASHGAQLQTRRTPQLLSIDGTDGQTDGRTTVSYRPCPAYSAPAVSANNISRETESCTSCQDARRGSIPALSWLYL